MRTIRQKISKLKTKIDESFSNEADLLGYAGISKQGIIESLTQSYDLLIPLEKYDDKFETILAKREVSKYIDNIYQFINDDLNSERATSKFNDCLNSTAKIRFILRDTYISLTESPLRADCELEKAKIDLKDLTEILKDLKTAEESINEIKTNSKSFISELETKHTKSIENERRINEFVGSIYQIEEEVTGTNEKITSWKSEIQIIKEDIINKQDTITKLKSEIEQVKRVNIENQNAIKEHDSTLKDQFKTNALQQDIIQKTIEDVSRYGMAGSFKKRKDELKCAQLIWAALTIIALWVLIYTSYCLIKPIINRSEFEVSQLLYKVPVFASCVWLAWFCSKQYGYISRIREDYAYKYAISMAFEGYKNETREINSNLSEKLIELTILNVSKNPVSNYNTKHNHGSPYNEMFESLTKRFFKSEKNEKHDE